MYEIEGNMKECKFPNKVEAESEPHEKRGNGFRETADRNFTQTINEEPVCTMREYVEFVIRNRELYDSMMEKEINHLDISVKKDGKGNTTCMSKVLREYRDDVIELNACDKAVHIKGKKRKGDLADYVHEEKCGGQARLRQGLCEREGADLRDPRQVSEVDLEKLIMSNNNLEMQLKEKLVEVLLRYTEFLTTRPVKM
jgi:hypothetical protein